MKDKILEVQLEKQNTKCQVPMGTFCLFLLVSNDDNKHFAMSERGIDATLAQQHALSGTSLYRSDF